MTAKCEVPSLTLGPCDLEVGHEGEMHASAGDGFASRCGTCRKPLVSGEWTEDTELLFRFVCKECP